MLASGITIEFGDHIQRFRMQRAQLYTLRKLMFIWERRIYNMCIIYITFSFNIVDIVQKIIFEDPIWIDKRKIRTYDIKIL